MNKLTTIGLAAASMLLAASANAAAQSSAASASEMAPGTDRAFGYETITTAPPANVWQVWTDVAAWKDWDQGLADAEGSVSALGAEGVVIGADGTRSPFRVTEYEEGRAYAFTTALPNGSLIVRRSIIGTDPTVIRHDVVFEGEGGIAMSGTLGPIFRKVLPPTVEAVADRAEAFGR